MRGITYVEYRDIISDRVEYYLCISVAWRWLSDNNDNREDK